MIEVEESKLLDLLQECKDAAKYAWDHYEELAARKHTYTLYGPFDYGIGAADPGGWTKQRIRQLSKRTRREKYCYYELDENYMPLRTCQVLHGDEDYIYHHFEYNGKLYAFPFKRNRKLTYVDEIYVTQFVDRKPVYSALGSLSVLHAEYYEYLSEDKMRVSYYTYRARKPKGYVGKMYDGVPVNGANSEISSYCKEEPIRYIDFAMWFTNPEAVRLPKKTITEGEIYEGVANWLDAVLAQASLENVNAFCFNLYENGGQYSIELIGAPSFDKNDEDWACDEVTNWGTRDNPYVWEDMCEWASANRKIGRVLRKYLKEGKYADVLKSKSAVGVGFVDGDLRVLYSK